MKQSTKYYYYVGLFLAVLMLLVKPLLPHHHHGGEACFVVEYCLSDHVDNDVHTGHHGDLSTCEDHAPSYCSHVGTSTPKAHIGTWGGYDLLLWSAVFLFLSFFVKLQEPCTSCNLILPAPLGRKHGLRAPPQLFS